MKHSTSPRSIGILGGGQLARMMALRAHAMGIAPWVLSSSPMDPAAQVTSFWRQGDPDNAKDLKRFLKSVDVATVESEFFNSEILQRSQDLTGVKIYPQPKILGLLQDRQTQKLLLQKHKVPTLPFLPINDEADLIIALAAFHMPLVLKKRRFGYDGYGTFIIKSPREIKSFLQNQLRTNQVGFIAEPFMKFQRELAVSVARNRQGEVIQLPIVETRQKNSICHWVKGPINSRKIVTAIRAIQHFVKSINYVGIVAFELFDSPSGIWVNEIAPRVHNSAHYSMDALACDQFEYHVRAICGQPLPRIRSKSLGFAMVNLLGGKRPNARWVQSKNFTLHWYGKLQNRKGRKMGHINVLGKNPDQALKLALTESQRINL